MDVVCCCRSVFVDNTSAIVFARDSCFDVVVVVVLVVVVVVVVALTRRELVRIKWDGSRLGDVGRRVVRALLIGGRIGIIVFIGQTAIQYIMQSEAR